jgi:L-alanine-DL-glutamate epimerase-like enolase superfamily enzyme
MRIDSFEKGALDLSLRSTFRTHWKTIRSHRTVHVRLSSGDASGEGEAYALDPDSVLRSLDGARVTGRDAWDAEAILGEIADPAARSAVDLALLDLLGRSLALPARSLLGLPRGEQTTCASIGIDDREEMIKNARGWIEKGYRIIKIKLTTTVDPSIVGVIRAIGGDELRIWVDANQAFDPEGACEVARVIAPEGVEIFEQPLRVGMLDAYRSIRSRIGIPIFLDEEIRGPSDVGRAALMGGIDGVNVKLAKMGGIREGLRAIHVARAHGMKILLGCFFESSLGIAGSAQLLGIVDYVDLDSPLHLGNDPYHGLEYVSGVVRTPDGPGLGVSRGDG